MKLFWNSFFFIWRCWLWILVLFGLIFFSPFSIILTSSPKTYFLFHLFCKYWCRFVLLLNGFWYSIKQNPKLKSDSAYIICPNHTSKFDIILLFATFPNTFVFMGKKNVSKIPIFEWFYNRTMITFERGSVGSAVKAYRKADRILKSGVSIVVFPEGMVPKNHIRLGAFMSGAFKLAISNKVPIIPITFVDNKNKYPEDELKIHFGKLRVYIHDPINTCKMSLNNLEALRNRTYREIDNTLIKYENNSTKNTKISKACKAKTR